MAESFGIGLAQGAGTAIAGELENELGFAIGNMTGYNRAQEQRQLRQQQALTNMQATANLGLMNASYDRQFKMWQDTNYPAQVAMLQKAGLNPALMYAKGGPGGITGSGNASVGGGQSSDVSSMEASRTARTGMALQLAKLGSEIELNKSIANRNNAEVPKVGAETVKTGAETTNIQATTELIAQQTKNAEIANQGMQIDNDIKSLQRILQSETLSTSIDQVKTTLEKTKSEIGNIIANTFKSKVEGSILDKASNDIISTYNQTLKNLITENILKNKDIGLKSEEIINAVNDRVLSRFNSITERSYKENEIEVQKSMQELQKILVEMQVDQSQQNAIMSAVSTVVGALVFKGAFSGGRNVIGGFK